jgi:hypothetical protein
MKSFGAGVEIGYSLLAAPKVVTFANSPAASRQQPCEGDLGAAAFFRGTEEGGMRT